MNCSVLLDFYEVKFDRFKAKAQVYCSVLQYVALCCSVLQYVALCCRPKAQVCCCVLLCVAVCCCVLLCVAVCCCIVNLYEDKLDRFKVKVQVC